VAALCCGSKWVPTTIHNAAPAATVDGSETVGRAGGTATRIRWNTEKTETGRERKKGRERERVREREREGGERGREQDGTDDEDTAEGRGNGAVKRVSCHGARSRRC